MQQNHPSPVSAPQYLPAGTEMAAIGVPGLANISPSDINSSFDWSELLDFNVNETFVIPFPEAGTGADSGAEPGVIGSSSPENVSRIRKRDPRLLCPNFLAGRVPCVCPDMDEKTAAEEEAALPGKKRTRTGRVVGGRPIRCQVSGCEADITELKGYHKRHRVCLHCANASCVEIDGEQKRYCQQCGKFHPLPDFDEGKRSCRRKLERHNNRRRRKPDDSKQSRVKEAQQINLEDDVSGDDDSGKDGICVSSRVKEGRPSLESEGQEPCPSLGSQKQQSDDINADTQKQNSIQRSSPSSGENKNTFSSACPTARISFKLYDWNPAEFPRRLRLQIFQWLASMPVELEGYIRPGCTILTAFVAMPRPMWRKLLDDPIMNIRDLISSPGNELSRGGSMLIYMNDMAFRVTKDRNSLVKIKVKDCCPRLHYVHPTCFVAGRPIEFVACGSNLLQSNLRFLISFSGRYLAYNISVPSRCRMEIFGPSFDHQLVKIVAPLTDENLVGPAFIEVENQSGLSNFVPILVGDRETCDEMQHLIQDLDISPFSGVMKPCLSCKIMAARQARLSEFLLDVAWLLKPEREKALTASDVPRFNSLIKFLVEKESSAVLERVLRSLSSALSKYSGDGISLTDMSALQKNISNAECTLLLSRGKFCIPCSKMPDQLAAPATEIVKHASMARDTSESQDSCSTVPLLAGDVEMNFDRSNANTRRNFRLPLRPSFLSSRSLMAIAAIVFCIGACMLIFHPHSVSLIAVTIRRCMFDMS